MSLNIENKKIAIIGAGMSGLSLAKKLSTLCDVTVFDKSRGMGGRMTTKRAGDYHFDHGAQFFTAKTKPFKDFCQEALLAGMVEEWNPKYAEIVGENIHLKGNLNDDKKHFVSLPQMNSLCKYLAQDLNVKLNHKVQSIDFENDSWHLHCENESFDGFDFLVLAIPAQQAVDLLPKSFQFFDLVSTIKMTGCFTLMLGLKEKLSLDFDAAFVKESILSWMCLNHSKPGRPQATSLLVNSSNQWAEQWMEEDLEEVKKQMMETLNTLFDVPPQMVDFCHLHRWRYANAPLQSGQKSLFDRHLKLGVCGDWLMSGKVESAYVSGMDLYEKLC